MKKHNKNSNKGIEFLPLKLVKEYNTKILFNNDYQYTTKNNFLKCISIIHNHLLTDFFDLNYYIPLGSAYWKKVFNNNYHQSVIQPLLDMKIIESKRFDNPNHWFKPNLNTSLNDKYVVAANDINDLAIPLIIDDDTIQLPHDDNLSVNKIYKTDDSKGVVEIRYRINPELIDVEEFVEVKYLKTISNIIYSESITIDGEDEEYEQDEEYESLILKGVLNVTIEKDKALHWIKYNAETVFNDFFNLDIIKSLPTHMKIAYKMEDKRGTFNKRFDSVTNIIKKADELGMQLFFYKDKYFVADLERFKANKLKAIKHVYSREVNKIAALPPITGYRNTKTLRIYNNLVNFPSKLLQFIRFNNRTIVQLDLRTSQFLLFANLMNQYIKDGGKHLLDSFSKPKNKRYLKRLIVIMDKHKHFLPAIPVDINNRQSCIESTNDVHMFIRDVFYNDFYEIVSKELNLNNRMIAKQLLFHIFFAFKLNMKDEYVKKLADKYPTVMSIIADFKIIKDDAVKKTKIINQKSNKTKKKDDINNFPVFLQCIEAEIFIDNILFKLRDKIPCASRHDSIMVANGYENETEKYIKNVFDMFNFRYNQKADDYFWDVYGMEELDDCGFSDWVSDEDLLFESNYYQKIREEIKPEKENAITPELENGNDFDDEFYNDFYLVFENIPLTVENDSEDDSELEEERCFTIEEIAKDIELKELFFDNIYDTLNKNDIELPEQRKDDYFDYFNINKLYGLFDIDGLSQVVKIAIGDDILNLQSNECAVPSFQDKTNELIRLLVKYL